MYLGLDVGGSRCRWEWWPQDAAPGGDADGAQPVAPGVQAVGERLATALAAATRAARRAPIAAVCATAGVGDASTAAAVADALRARGVAFPVAVTGDVLAAAAAGLADGPGVLLWSGTGSFAIARDAAGALHRVGGRGFLLGDQGSGYDLVRRAAAAALLAADDLGPPCRSCSRPLQLATRSRTTCSPPARTASRCSRQALRAAAASTCATSP